MSNIAFMDCDAKVEWITFSDKTETCTIKPHTLGGGDSSHAYKQPVGSHIQCVVEDGTRDLLRLGLVKDALDRIGIQDVKLTLEYFPQARADRVFCEGQPLPVKVFADILNSFGFAKVYIFDAHSDVTPALIKNVEIVHQADLVKMKLPLIKKFMPTFNLVAPDTGAAKKINDVAKAIGKRDYIQAVKLRDVATGEIIKCDLQIDGDIEGNVLIVDDIADKGGSFMHLADMLKSRGAKHVGLFVSHAIFPEGLAKLAEHIDFLFINDFVGGYIDQDQVDIFNEYD